MERDFQKLLDEQLDEQHVKTREQSGVRLSYVEGWYVIEQANVCFGFDGWSSETLEVKQVQEEQKLGSRPKPGDEPKWYVGYTAKVRITALGVVRDGYGAGSGIDKDLFRAHESAVKEAETDALKRAFRSFGYRFGLALYDKTQSNVTKNGKPKAAKLAEGSAVEAKARKAWEKIGGIPHDFNSFVSEHGQKIAYGAIAKASEQGISLEDALRELQNA